MEQSIDHTTASKLPPLVMRREHHNPVRLLREVHAAFRDEAQERGVGFSLILPIKAPSIDCDRDHMVQALSDLVEAALAATPRAGTVTLALLLDDTDLCRFVMHSAAPGSDGESAVFVLPRDFRDVEEQPPHDRRFMLARRIIEMHGGQLILSDDSSQARFDVLLAHV